MIAIFVVICDNIFHSEYRFWSRSSAKIHPDVPRKIVRGMCLRKRSLGLLFTHLIHQLREIWSELISKSTRKDGKMSLNVFAWLNKVTLDIIGLAGETFSVKQHLRKTC